MKAATSRASRWRSTGKAATNSSTFATGRSLGARVQLTLLKGPPPAGGYNFANPWSSLYPAPGFLFEAAYPADCLDVRSIYAPPGLMPDLDPLPALWRVDNDPTPNIVGGVAVGPGAKVIYHNVVDAIMNYRARITDPGTFDTGFTTSLIQSLGKKFAKAFGQPPQETQQDTAEAISTANLASSLERVGRW